MHAGVAGVCLHGWGVRAWREYIGMAWLGGNHTETTQLGKADVSLLRIKQVTPSKGLVCMSLPSIHYSRKMR